MIQRRVPFCSPRPRGTRLGWARVQPFGRLFNALRKLRDCLRRRIRGVEDRLHPADFATQNVLAREREPSVFMADGKLSRQLRLHRQLQFGTQLPCAVHHMLQRLFYLGPAPRFQAAVGVDPQLLGLQHVQRLVQQIEHFRRVRHAR